MSLELLLCKRKSCPELYSIQRKPCRSQMELLEQQERIASPTFSQMDQTGKQQEQQQQISKQLTTTILSLHDLALESVMPGIYLTKNFTVWTEEILRSHEFTHLIIIDRHIQELYYPATPLFKLSPTTRGVAATDVDPYEGAWALDYNARTAAPAHTPTLDFSKEFKVIDLNFGEKSYLTTVLPNCYRAVKFIEKALLQTAGQILIIDCNGGEQKCVTIVVAYLMYRHNISFSEAFGRLKKYFQKADLDRFYMSQLYEYEPILQVQRAHSRGHSCSRFSKSAILKRKNVEEHFLWATIANDNEDRLQQQEQQQVQAIRSNNGEMDFLNNFNPLSQFNVSQHQNNNNNGNFFNNNSNQNDTRDNSNKYNNQTADYDCLME